MPAFPQVLDKAIEFAMCTVAAVNIYKGPASYAPKLSYCLNSTHHTGGELMKRVVAVLLICAGIQGCSLLTRPLDMPVIEEKLNRAMFTPASVGTLSLTPERRVVLVNFANNRFCAEAPTEIGIDVAALNKLKADATQGDKTKVGLEYLNAATNQNSVLNKRTQGMQLFLANSYFTCQMYMNGGLDERQMLEMQFQTLKIIEPLILEELKYLYKDHPKETTQLPQERPIKEGAKELTDSVLKEKSAKPNDPPTPTPGN